MAKEQYRAMDVAMGECGPPTAESFADDSRVREEHAMDATSMITRGTTFTIFQTLPGAMLALAVALPGTPARADELNARGNEESVLIDAREATSEDATVMVSDGVESLEPISRMAEKSPEPADDLAARAAAATNDDDSDDAEESDSAREFGAALHRAAAARRGKSSRRLAHRGDVANDDVASVFTKATTPRVAKFNGIRPGYSSSADVRESWGEPLEVLAIDGGEVLTYDTEPFRQVDVVIAHELVETIKVELAKPTDPAQLSRQLGLEEVDASDVSDPSGELLGQVFPERGVLFMYTLVDSQTAPLEADLAVSHVVIQAIDPVAFMLRAENELHGPYQRNINDLKYALSLDPELAHANWLLADIYLATGQAALAEEAAAKAYQSEPTNDAYRLRWARALQNLARYDEAVEETRAVLDGVASSSAVQAQALYQMGLLATIGDAEIRSKAIPFFNRSIEIADQLATSGDRNERKVAKELLVDAHLAVAREIAAQPFDDQIESISQWIGRASGLAEDAIAKEGASLELRLRVAEMSLAALAELKPTKDPQPWIDEAQSAADLLADQSDDVLWQRRIKWQLGVSYFHAVRTEHTRRQTSSALRFGQKAIEYLAEGAKSRQAVPDSEHLVGRLYFHLGAVHAVHQRDHAKATSWYDKAVPMLTVEVPVTELAVPRRHGESLVSMGVSYWQQGERAKALELTQLGVDLVERAVAGGVLDKKALAVPYGNLATMHKELGNRAESAKFANLARTADPTTVRRTATNNGRRNASRQNSSGNSRRQNSSSSRSRQTALSNRPSSAPGRGVMAPRTARQPFPGNSYDGPRRVR